VKNISVDRLQLNAYMRRACSGDCEAFGALAADVQDELYRLALASGLQPADAVEAVQETLLRAFAGRQGWRQGSDVMGWLCGFVVNICRERYRDRRRRLALPLEECRSEACAAANPATQPWEPEQLRQLMKAIAKLPPRQRQAIACRYLRRMSIREAAEAMGCAEGTVKSAASAALERLREILEGVT
jgi:RNA polymerase sigma-70 factor (ECF subfamily)